MIKKIFICIVLLLSIFLVSCNEAITTVSTEDPAKGTENEDSISAETQPISDNVNGFNIRVSNLSTSNGFSFINYEADLYKKLLALKNMKKNLVSTEGTMLFVNGEPFGAGIAKELGWKWCIRISKSDEDSSPNDDRYPAEDQSYIYCNDSSFLFVNSKNNTKVTYEVIDDRYDLPDFISYLYEKRPSKLGVEVAEGTLLLPDQIPKKLIFTSYGSPDVSYGEDLDSIYGILKGFTDVKVTETPKIFDYFGGSVLIGMHVKFENHYIIITLHDQEDVIMIDDVWYAIGDSEQLHKLINIAKGRK